MPTTLSPKTKLLKINGIAKYTTPPPKALIIHHNTALKLLITAEATATHPAEIRKNIPAIISSWLDTPKQAPDQLDGIYGEKWINLLRYHAIESDRNPALGPKKPTKNPKPIYLTQADDTEEQTDDFAPFTISNKVALKL